MPATSKHARLELMGILRSGIARRLAVTLAGAALLGLLPALQSATAAPLQLPAATLAAGGPWLDRLNQWRANAGVAGLSENTTWSAGDYDHALYMVKDDQATHYEIPGYNYYTVAGDTAARNSNIEVMSSTSFSDQQAIDWWMAAPFHAMNMMDPRLTSTGFGSYRQSKSGWQAGFALDTLRGNSFSGGAYPVYFPGNGTTEPLTSYSGGEYPDPLQACSGYRAPTGLPVFLQVGGNVTTTAGAHSLTGNGVALAHCVIDAHSPSVGSGLYYRGGVIVIPKAPLQNGVKYVVALTVNGIPYTWSFTVGPFNSCASVTVSAAPPSPSLDGTPVTFTGSATGCPNPLYQFWTQAPGSTTWQIVQPYSTSATFNWSTAGKVAGTYQVAVWARDAASPGLQSSLGRYDTLVGTTYTLTVTGACKSATDSAAPASPAAVGTTVVFTAGSTVCLNPQYAFWVLKPGSSTWQVAQAYSSTKTFSWNTSGQPVGPYNFSVWARDATSPGTSGDSLGTWDAYVAAQYSLTQPCTSVAATSAPASTAKRGTAVTITGSAGGCSNPLYEFWILIPGSSTWQLAQAYSAGATFKWSTTGGAAGVYHFSVWARDASSAGIAGNSLGRWDAYIAVSYTLA